MSDPHPLEKVFNLDSMNFIEPEVLQVSERERSIVDPTSGEVINRVSDPDTAQLEKEERLEDLHIDGQLETIHGSAMAAFEQQRRMADEVDPRFAARNSEVAAQYLTIALNAVNSRVDAKFKRQKVRIAKQEAGTPNTVNNNVIIADRNEVLRAFRDKGKVVDE